MDTIEKAPSGASNLWHIVIDVVTAGRSVGQVALGEMRHFEANLVGATFLALPSVPFAPPAWAAQISPQTVAVAPQMIFGNEVFMGPH